MRIAVCTIVARNYLALARSLLASVVEFEPSFDRFVFILDDLAAAETFDEGTIVRPEDVFACRAFAELARGYGVVELATAVKPAVLRHLLDRGYDRAFFFDPDIQVFAPLDAVIEPLDTNDIVLTPHATDPLPLAGRLMGEMIVLRTGVYNLGFIGVADAPGARAMLDWWEERLREYCRNDRASGLFMDQRWIDLVPALFERTAIVRHRGCNVAYWNLGERKLARGAELRLVTGERVVFFHFSGFDARKPGRLCKYPTRTNVSEEPRLRELLASYARRLIALGHLEYRRRPFALRAFSPKALLRSVARRLTGYRAQWIYGSGTQPRLR